MPDWRQLLTSRLRAMSPHESLDPDTIEELAQHLDDRYDELRAGGLPHEEAVDATLQEWEDQEWRDAPRRQPPPPPRAVLVHDMSASGSLFVDLWRDLQHGWRVLAHNPGFGAAVVATLAFGIAANTVAFTVINTLLLTPLPVGAADRLVTIATRETADAGNAAARLPLSYPNFRDLQRRNAIFDSLAAYAGPFGVTLTGHTPPQRIFAELVTATYFDTLEIRPLIGRFILAEEDRAPGAHPVVVLGHTAWQRRFAGRADILGETIEINGTRFTVIGVAPPGFKGLDPIFGPDVWMPSMMTAQVVPIERRQWLTDRAASSFRAVGRLRSTVSVAQAEAAATGIAAQLEREFPAVNRGRSISLEPLSRRSLMGVSPQLATLGSLALLTIPGLVLLIACANVAGLVLIRATTRGQELAVRLALGAGRSRIVRQLLTENALLGCIGAAVGLAAAWAGAHVLWSFRPAEYAQNLVDVSVDGTVVLFAVFTSGVTILLFGLAPALHAARRGLVAGLTSDTRTAGQARRATRWQKALLVGQVALSLTALATAGLFLQGLQRAYAVDPGFERQQLGVVMLNPGQAGYDNDRAEQLYRTIRERVGSVPGVVSVSLASNLPLFSGPSRKIATAGATQLAAGEGALTVMNTVDVEYFTAAGVAITQGRAFDERDRRDGQPVAIINETLARRYWNGRDPIGDRIAFVADDVPRRIVGIAATVTYDDLGEPPQPCVYLPLAQNFTDAVVLYVKTAGDPGPVLATVQREIQRLDSRLDVADARTIHTVLDQALFGRTMASGLLALFGLIALALASLGIYGVAAYTVQLRRREMSVRLALGAEPNAVFRLVVRQAFTLVSIGAGLGLAGAVGAAVIVSSIVPDVRAIEPVSLIGAAAALGAVAFVACVLPARAASRLDPVSVLRAH
jgi:predicted permease